MGNKILPGINARLVVALAIFGAMCLPKAAAAQIDGTLDVTLTLESACVINEDPTVSGVDFGTLAFGTHPALFTGILTEQASTSGSPTQVRCSPDVETLSITISAGNNGGEGSAVGEGSRALKHETADAYVPYELYADPSMTATYTADEAVQVDVPTPGAAFDLPIYGRINKTSSDALPTGDYTDLVTITITF